MQWRLLFVLQRKPKYLFHLSSIFNCLGIVYVCGQNHTGPIYSSFLSEGVDIKSGVLIKLEDCSSTDSESDAL